MMPTLPEREQARQTKAPYEPPAPAHPWPIGFVVFMLFVVGFVSLIGGGVGAYLAVGGLEQAWRLPV